MIFLHSKSETKNRQSPARHLKSGSAFSPEAWYANVLGQSLEVQVVPPKSCPGACLYCPFGETTHQTIDRELFYPTEEILHSVADRICREAPVKSIVIGGHGEPTLHADLGGIIGGIKRISSAPIAVDSCGCLLWMPGVQKSLQLSNAVFANIDAADKEVFQLVNRFQLQIPFVRFINGIRAFRATYKGDLYVRVCLIDGINANEAYVIELAEFVNSFAPKAVIVRTSAVAGSPKAIPPVDNVRLQYLASHFGPAARVMQSPPENQTHSKEKVCL